MKYHAIEKQPKGAAWIPDLTALVAAYVIFRALEIFVHEISDTRTTPLGKSIIYFSALVLILVAVAVLYDTFTKATYIQQKVEPLLK